VEERRLSAASVSKKDSRASAPVASDAEIFRTLAKAGQRLAEIHVHYEQQLEYKLTQVEKKGEKLDYRVTKMKLSKDKATLIYNQFLTLSGIPKETYDYRLGNRSALDGSSINIRSPPTSAAASRTTQTARTTPPTCFA
jgi:predicted helicase